VDPIAIIDELFFCSQIKSLDTNNRLLSAELEIPNIKFLINEGMNPDGVGSILAGSILEKQ